MKNDDDTKAHLDAVAAAARSRKEAETRLVDEVLAARQSGASLRTIATAAMLSHQRIHQIVRTEP